MDLGCSDWRMGKKDQVHDHKGRELSNAGGGKRRWMWTSWLDGWALVCGKGTMGKYADGAGLKKRRLGGFGLFASSSEISSSFLFSTCAIVLHEVCGVATK